mgnify:CR=1 FL=1|tara:strand:- start:171387 stop:171866 length:480 start_codon:yes stop_codon:yes gene_type:complete
MRLLLLTSFTLIFSLPFAETANAHVIADCFPWTPTNVDNSTANDCVLQIWDEPVVPDVDLVFVSMYVSSHVYTSAGYQGLDTENDGNAALYPGPLNEVDTYATVYALVENVVDSPVTLIEHNPYCWTANFEYHYVPGDSYHLYRNVGDCGGWYGYTRLW